MKKTILLIDDSMTNLSIGKNALSDRYSVLTAPSGEKALSLLEKVRPDLILLDINMPEMDGYETIRHIKDNPSLTHIPVIFLTVKNDDESELTGLSMGAVDYITKPFSQILLKKRIEIHLLIDEQQRQLTDYNINLHNMVQEKTKTITKLQDSILSTVAELVEFRDNSTGGHIERSSLYLHLLINKMKEKNIYKNESADWNINLIVRSAQLHDVGKICISDVILRKPGKLNEAEYMQMKEHAALGKKVIERIMLKTGESEFLQQAAILAYSHHERWDGHGYPLGLKGTSIPLQGRLMAIADVYDSLISTRAYKTSFSHQKSKSIILEGAGTQFDPALTEVFDEVSEEFADISQQRTPVSVEQR